MKFVDVLRKIESGQSFSLKWMTCDLRRGKGGEIRMLDNLRLLVEETESRKGGQSKKPAQYTYEHSRPYLNLWHEPTGRHVKLYKRLILEIDGIGMEY